MPEFGEELGLEHPLEVAYAPRPPGPPLEADDALHGGHVVEAPAAEIVLEVDELLGQLVELPMRLG
jgi:hypothetical protein